METNENLTGFIVEVISKNGDNVEFKYGKNKKILRKGETFLGYFGCMYNPDKNGKFQTAQIDEIHTLNNRTFKYGPLCEFQIDEVQISIKALRGPNSFREDLEIKYETWNPINSPL